jgi:hypothetical protein
MAELLVRLRDAARRPLDDVADVLVSTPASGTVLRRARDVKGTTTVKVGGLAPLEPYLVRVFPVRHRPVSRFVRIPASGTEAVELFCPVDPERVESVKFPAYQTLRPQARAILEASRLEDAPADLKGRSLYESARLDPLPRAGLLNLLTKMARTAMPDGSAFLDHVSSLHRIRADRVFADVATGLRDLVKSGVAGQDFRPVSGKLHEPPRGFALADSFKSGDAYGNLQVTFFASLDAPLRFQADIDIDDAAGLKHVFQVLDHWLTEGVTHPYDIHEILLFHQELDPGYRLVT